MLSEKKARLSSTSDLLKNNKFHATLYWICKEWKVLPTDQRFKDLTIEQINWLVYWSENFDKPAPPEEPTEDIQNLLNQGDNQDRVTSQDRERVQSNIKKLEDITKTFEAGGDVTDWEDITSEFLGKIEEQ